MYNNDTNNTETNNIETDNIETNSIEHDVNPEKPKRSIAKYYKSEAVKRAKSKYYQKMKQDETYTQNMRNKSLNWYYQNKAKSNPANEIEIYLLEIIAE